MELLRARALTRYRSAAPGAAKLFDDVSLVVADGDRIGLLGPNASGKSTLLNLLAAVEQPLEGSVSRAPGVRVAHLQQSAATTRTGTVWQTASAGLGDLRAIRERLAAEESRITAGEERREEYARLTVEHERLGGYRAESLVREILAALGFPAGRLGAETDRLSSGERQRLALAAVLCAGADVLLLDEPTNNLDLDARVWLERHLVKRGGAVVLVSHDRALLAAATNKTASLRGDKLALGDTGYGGSGKQWRSPTHGGSARGRLVSADHLHLEGVITDVSVRLDAGERIALLGPNGSGKSALLALLAGDLASQDHKARIDYAPGLKLLWLPQEGRGLRDEATLIDQARELLGDAPARRTLAAAGVRHEAWSRSPRELSGGERARAGLALAMARPFDLLLLDEPDNDLDLGALESLESDLRTRLDETGAALVLVTHDRRLALNLTSRAWSIDSGQLLAHGSVRAYLRGEEPGPASRFWSEDGSSELAAAGSAVQDTSASVDEVDELERERAELLESLLDPLASSERERLRSRERLAAVEERLMTLYDDRHLPPGTYRRLVENGLVIYADSWWPEPTPEPIPGLAGSEPTPEPAGSEPHRGAERWVALAAAGGTDVETTVAALRRPREAGVPWLELVRVGDGAHLVLHEVEGSVLLPWSKGALLDAGIRLAFTVLGVRFCQYFNRDAIASDARRPRSTGTLLEAVGDGWWRVTLARFLASQGWRADTRGRRRRERQG